MVTKPRLNDAVARLQGFVAELEARRVELQEQRTLIEATPRSREEALADAERIVAALADRADVQPGVLTQGPRAGTDLMHAMSPQRAAVPDPWAVVAAVAPDLLHGFFVRALDAEYERLPAPMTSAERRTALAELDRRLHELETELAGAWWQAHAEGLELPLPDVSPAALLGLSLAQENDR